MPYYIILLFYYFIDRLELAESAMDIMLTYHLSLSFEFDIAPAAQFLSNSIINIFHGT
ncbi:MULTISPECIES: hypothetical protein [unclassified Colwellia]|jgi:hypothetical protein|uniref:hypothetical protein n=1 Tax=unclassified Colwellia TaxID=196834 RepID=UPI0015F4301C|nr:MULTISPECIES: hypothetical protein [unclassified Colwellia]MBA6253268.1 hypothetical protein [Colwellia sp. MB3u-55]MBA6397885.1 hypothetical protein [Colwellia sp. BRX10-4]